MEFFLDEYLEPSIASEADLISINLKNINQEIEKLTSKRKINISNEKDLKSSEKNKNDTLKSLKNKRKSLESELNLLQQEERSLEISIQEKNKEIHALTKTRRSIKLDIESLEEKRKLIECDKKHFPRKKSKEICKGFEKYLNDVQKKICDATEILQGNILISIEKDNLAKDKEVSKYYNSYTTLKEVGEQEASNILYDKIKNKYPRAFDKLRNLDAITLYFIRNNKDTCLLFLPIRESSLKEKSTLSFLAFSFLEKFKKNIKGATNMKVIFSKGWLTIQLNEFEEDIYEVSISNDGKLSFMVEESDQELGEVLQNEIN